ncbi:hypothetical protein B0H15DRAFT_796322 [Mycena belliarum]|uniref:Uncharacterized protein n=1 Tax=Mycena belliarum TaxID=1033014 RepID=A0AAD6UK46_9AGAR|nr:hypothetical protein B0H15DRAFT_796322 [Mycena belliae]
MFSNKSFFALAVVALATIVSAAPAKPVADVSASITACSGGGTGCVTVPVVSDSCVNLTGGLSFLNKEISQFTVPGGFVCTLFQDFGCTASGTGNAGSDSEVVLTQGTWNMFFAPGLSGTTNFNDLTSSFSCSPV